LQERIPLVSIIIPAHNHAAFVAAALQSVVAQTHPRLELIVIDDGSTDATAAVIEQSLSQISRDMRMVFHRQENCGLGSTLQRALALATGEFVQFLASDDALFPEMTARLVAVLSQAGDGVAAAGCDGYVVDARGGVSRVFSDLHPIPFGRDQHRELMVGNWLPAMGMLYRREIVLQEGGIAPELVYEDWGLLLALTRRYRVIQIPDRLFAYRQHGQNISADGARMRLALQALTRRYPEMAEARDLRLALARGDLRGILGGISPSSLGLAARFVLRLLQRRCGLSAGRLTALLSEAVPRRLGRGAGGAQIKIGRGCRIHPEARLQAGPGALVVGDHCQIGAGARLVAGLGLSIGAGSFIAEGASLGGAEATTRIGGGCLIAARSRIEAGSDLGEACVILPGSRVAGRLADGVWLGTDGPI
jgi:alpha-1,3-rhamnosyltransferase